MTRNDDLTPQLKEAYAAAQKNNALIKKRLEILRTADKEDTPLVQGVDKLAAIKPKGILLTRLEVASSGGVVLVEGVSETASIFNQYVELINNEKVFFQNGQLERISSTGTQSVKTFTIKASTVR